MRLRVIRRLDGLDEDGKTRFASIEEDVPEWVGPYARPRDELAPRRTTKS